MSCLQRYRGAFRFFTLTCPQCSGSGESATGLGSIVWAVRQCVALGYCNGEGTIVKKPCLTCSVTDGNRANPRSKSRCRRVSEGNYIPLHGQGNAGKRGGPAGDVIVEFEQGAHEHFIRNADDVIYNALISYPDAVLGGDIEVPTLPEPPALKSKAGTMREKCFG